MKKCRLEDKELLNLRETKALYHICDKTLKAIIEQPESTLFVVNFRQRKMIVRVAFEQYLARRKNYVKKT